MIEKHIVCFNEMTSAFEKALCNFPNAVSVTYYIFADFNVRIRFAGRRLAITLNKIIAKFMQNYQFCFCLK